MKGYYRDEAATRTALSGGWLRSGDLGYVDDEGDIRLVDRKGECINTGGEKVFPQEVEEVIVQHPGVEQACVIGVEDEEWGSVVTAVVQRRPGHDVAPDELVALCRKTLGGYKVPRGVIFVDELPLSAVGKVQRARVRELYGHPTRR
jgi:acyl-CoA synthetase (AMP-forming)/AMP-acid ligase II